MGMIETLKGRDLQKRVRRKLGALTGSLRELIHRRTLGQTVAKYVCILTIPEIRNAECDSYEKAVLQSFHEANAGIGKLPEWILSMDGQSGWKYRLFINNLVQRLPDPHYLEIGSYKGSTAVSSIWKNSLTATCIDNWSQFGGPRTEFYSNIKLALSERSVCHTIDSDFRTVDYSSIGTHNIYLFDGPHEEIDHYDAIVKVSPALSNQFVLIVDDWNWRKVRLGTFRGIRQLGYSINYSIEIRTTFDNSHAVRKGPDSDWHNGYFLSVISKTP